MCFVIIFFGASVLITGCGEEDIMDPTVEWAESNGCIGDQVSGPYTVVPDED